MTAVSSRKGNPDIGFGILQDLLANKESRELAHIIIAYTGDPIFQFDENIINLFIDLYRKNPRISRIAIIPSEIPKGWLAHLCVIEQVRDRVLQVMKAAKAGSLIRIHEMVPLEFHLHRIMDIAAPLADAQNLIALFDAFLAPLFLREISDLSLLEKAKKLQGYLRSNINRVNGVTELTWKEATFTAFPQEIGLFANVEKLTIHNDCMTEGNIHVLPDSFRNFKKLKRLTLVGIGLRELPEWIGEFQCLSWLDLRSNHLRRLPDSICGLQKLQHLNLRSNCLESLPKNLGDLNSLSYINVKNNPFRTSSDLVPLIPLERRESCNVQSDHSESL